NLSSTNLNLVKAQAFLKQLFNNKINFRLVKSSLKKHSKKKTSKKIIKNYNNFSYFIVYKFDMVQQDLNFQNVLNKLCLIRDKLIMVKNIKKKVNLEQSIFFKDLAFFFQSK